MKINTDRLVLYFVLALVLFTLILVTFIGNDVKEVKHYQEIESGVVVDSLMQI